MKRPVKYIILLTLCLTMLIGSVGQVSALSDTNNVNKVLKQWADGINTKNADLYLSVFDNEKRNVLESNIKNATTNEDKKYLEFYSIISVSLNSIKKISLENIKNLYDISKYDPNTTEVYYFYFDAATDPNLQTKYTVNGKNFALCILTNQKDGLKISQFSVAPVSLLVLQNIDLGTKEEATLKSKVLESSKQMGLTSNSLSAIAVSPLIAASEPGYLRVKCEGTLKGSDGKTNYQYWNVLQYKAANVPFQTYIKDVLPNEWDSDMVVPDSSNASTIKWSALDAGALMVKSFSWYMWLNPWDRNNGFDVNDDYSQCYLHGTVSKQSADGKGIKFAWGSKCAQAFADENYVAIFYNGTTTPIAAYYVQRDQTATYNNNSLGAGAIINYIYSSTSSYPYKYNYSNFSCNQYLF